MKRYLGERTIDGIRVTVDDADLSPRFDLKALSPSGFEWTYEGAAPAQLALALLADHLGDEKALVFYEGFMRHVVANFENDWEMTSDDIDAALKSMPKDD